MACIHIAEQPVGKDAKPFIIAEVAQAHDGSLGAAKAYIELAASVGADAVKFQTHFADDESTIHEPWRVKFSDQDNTRYDYWKRMEFSEEQWFELKRHADKHGILFLSSVFSPRAFDLMKRIGMPAWKIASGEIHNLELLNLLHSTEEPILISTGLTTIEHAVEVGNAFLANGNEVAVFHCTTMYPTPSDQVGLNILTDLLSEHGDQFVIGLSDHSSSITPAIISAYLGARIFEFHIAFHEGVFGPDTPASLTPESFKRVVTEIRYACALAGNPVDKSTQVQGALKLKSIFGRSLFYSRDLPKGHVLSHDDISNKKPGNGMQYERLESLIGRSLSCDVRKDDFARAEHLLE